MLTLCIPFYGISQGFRLSNGKKFEKVNFKLINNLIIIPIEVNGAKLSFILDSGVSKPILFNVSDQDSVQLRNVSEITIKGLGGGQPIKGLSSKDNFFRLNEIRNYNQLLYVVLDKEMNFSPSLGIPIHGIIGYDLFRDFVVEINYSAEYIKFHDPEFYKEKENKKSQTLPIAIRRNRAYIEGNIVLGTTKDVPVKLLIDTGSTDAVWLFKDEKKGLGIPEQNYQDFLGEGLNGSIFGKRTKVNSINIGDFALKEAKAAFPDMETFSSSVVPGNRNGSIGGAILKRFNIVFNYPAKQITLKKNRHFSTPFQYNMSGLQLQHNGVRYIADRIADSRGFVINSNRKFGDVQILMENQTRLSLVPEIIVSGIRAGSPAELAGLQEGDIILAVNGRRIHSYKLQEVMKMLNEKEGKRIKVLIERYNKDLLFSFVLKKAFK
ncbi:aspartyl protease family protein [Eudoraea adriatica]|uniref:aspartyl protease family protein n=1 Tax=Eudoraea adriatica TaxID=446681 RepID=UPI001F0A750B|nr:aspartyl protease family protein [Eudoraea adriatica]